MGRLKRSFFARDTITVAKELLGKILMRRIGKKEIRARIIETEAYIGEEDQACHARFGKTKRNATMYGPAGHAYIYLCYGIHELLNIVTEGIGCPAAILIRTVKPLVLKNNRRNMHFEYDRTQNAYIGKKVAETLGPGGLTKYLQITRELNGEDLTKSKKLWVEDPGHLCSNAPHRTIRSRFASRKGVGASGLKVKSAERIGVSYAGEWAKKKWRFVLH